MGFGKINLPKQLGEKQYKGWSIVTTIRDKWSDILIWLTLSVYSSELALSATDNFEIISIQKALLISCWTIMEIIESPNIASQNLGKKNKLNLSHFSDFKHCGFQIS